MFRKKNEILIKSKKKRKKRKKLIFILLLLIFLIFTGIYLGLNWMIHREMMKVKELKKMNESYRQKIQNMLKYASVYEDVLRKKYGLIKEGEKIIIYSPTMLKKSRR